MAPAPVTSAATPAKPDSNPKIPDIMRGIGNMLRIAILKYNYETAQKELTKVLSEVKGLKSENTDLLEEVTRLNHDLATANDRYNQALNGLTYYYNQNQQLQQRNDSQYLIIQDLQNDNARLQRYLNDAEQHIQALGAENQGLRDAFAQLQHQLDQIQQQNRDQLLQLDQLQQQLAQARQATAAAQAEAAAATQRAQDATAAAQAEVAAAAQRAQDATAAAQAEAAAAQAAADDARAAQQQAQAEAVAATQRVTELQAELQNQTGVSAEEATRLRTELETARDEAQRANQAQQEAATAQAAAEQRAAEAAAAQQQAERQAAEAQADVAAANQARADAEQRAQTAEISRNNADIEINRLNQEAAVAKGRQTSAIAVTTAKAVAAAEQQAREANARAAESDAELANLQEQLTQQQLSNQEVTQLNRQLQEATQTAARDNEELLNANQALQRQLRQQQDAAEAAAAQATQEKQRLTDQLAALQQQMGTSGTRNTALQQQIIEAQQQLEQANADLAQRQQQANEANQRLQDQLQQVQTDATDRVAQAEQRAHDLEAALRTQGADNEAQQQLIQQQLQELQQQQAAAETARQQAAEQADQARQQAEERAAQAAAAQEQARQQAAAAQEEARRQVAAADQARQQAEERAAQAETARAQAAEAQQKLAEQQSAAEQAVAARNEAEARAGQEVGSLKQQLAEKESELEAQKLAQEAAVKEAEKKAAAAEDARAEAEAAKKAAEAAKTKSEETTNTLLESNQKSAVVLNASTEENKKLKSELDELKKQLAALTAAKEAEKQIQQDAASAEKQRKFDADKYALLSRVRDAKLKITKMTDEKCKQQLLNKAIQIESEVDALNPTTFTDRTSGDLDKKVQNLSEATGDKIRTFVSMRQEDGTSKITIDKPNKTVTTQEGGESTKVWGPFSDVFGPGSTNQAKYESMKADLLDDIPTKGTTVVIFGYGYSGSGKTYTLLGGNNKERKWEDGIAQLAIKGYLDAGCTVQMEEAFELYNNSYNYVDTNFKYRHGTEKNIIELSKDEDTFTEKIRKINAERKRLKHIKPTPNNPESSRGHLFIVLKITKNGNVGRLILCDMGGRENPNQMWTESRYVTIQKKKTDATEPVIAKQTYTVIRPVSKSSPGTYYDEDGTQKKIPTTAPQPAQQTPAQVFGKSGGSLSIALQSIGLSKDQTEILDMLKEGFYINDSINEMLAEFGYKGNEDQSNWSKTNSNYDPDIRALSVIVDIGISDIFKEFREKSNCKIQFCTFACIRSPDIFFKDSIATLKFAEAVNSVTLASTSRPAAVQDSLHSTASRVFGDPRNQDTNLNTNMQVKSTAKSLEDSRLSNQPSGKARGGLGQGGGSIRRHRRKKHAVFKTLKKSRPSSSASGLDSVYNHKHKRKSKHNTRNHKKHNNTRNRTVKK